MKGGLVDRARGILQRRRDRKQRKLAESYRQSEREDIRRRGQDWTGPASRGKEHRPAWRMASSPGPHRDAIRSARRARRERLHRKMGKGIVGYKTNARAGEL